MKQTLIALLSFFILSSAKANSIVDADTLSDYKWQHRVVITKVESNHELSLIKDQVSSRWHEYIDRKLIIFAMLASNNLKDSFELFHLQENALAPIKISINELKSRIRTANTLLIGLDGGGKSVYDKYNEQQIFADIDGMPMRQSELARKQANSSNNN